MTTGEFLATLRRANGLTQRDVAEKLGVSDRTLSSWETDRTAPDILLLPALADAYGVTVDEILRGERTAHKDGGELGDKALRSLKKRNYGKFTAKCALLCGIACTGALLFVISSVLLLFSSSPLWLDILLAVIGFLDITVCLTILFYFEYCARLGEGIVLDEDYTDDKKRYALAVKRRTSVCIMPCSLPFILGGIIFLLIFFSGYVTDFSILGITVYVTTPYLITTCVDLALGIILFLTALIYGNVNVIKHGGEENIQIHRQNRKLALKLAGFGAIPFVAFLVLFIVFLYVTPINKYITYCEFDTFEEYKIAMQTVEITEDDPIHTECGVEVGKYYLDFPQEFDIQHVYPLGNNFYGHYHRHYRIDLDRDVWEWYIYVLKPDAPSDTPPVNDYGYIVGENDYFYGYIKIGKDKNFYDVDNGRYVNVAYSSISQDSYGYDYGFGITSSGEIFEARQDNGKYGLYECEVLYMDVFFGYLFIIATAVTVITCTTVYLIKRKKQNYEF